MKYIVVTQPPKLSGLLVAHSSPIYPNRSPFSETIRLTYPLSKNLGLFVRCSCYHIVDRHQIPNVSCVHLYRYRHGASPNNTCASSPKLQRPSRLKVTCTHSTFPWTLANLFPTFGSPPHLPHAKLSPYQEIHLKFGIPSAQGLVYSMSCPNSLFRVTPQTDLRSKGTITVMQARHKVIPQ
jgi:hypothetical protein